MLALTDDRQTVQPMPDPHPRLRDVTEALLRVRPGLNEAIEASTTLVEDLWLDSVDMVELMVTLEERFSVHFDETELLLAETVGDILDQLDTALGSRPVV